MNRAAATTTLGDIARNDDRGRDALIGQLVQQDTGYLEHRAQIEAWKGQLVVLAESARRLIAEDEVAAGWQVILEYMIPRRSRRPDVVILGTNAIHVLEFKVGATHYPLADLWQARDYALDLRDYHEGSADHRVVPYLVATDAPAMQPREVEGATVHRVNKTSLWAQMRHVEDQSRPGPERLESRAWVESGYRPVPSIVEAADRLYHSHDIQEINHNLADNLTRTTARIQEIINNARENGRRVICFVTGVPGAGKTLTGLASIHASEMRSDGRPAGVFLSGNAPLVEVIQESIAQSTTGSRREARRTITTFVQNVHRFVDEYADPGRIPPEHVIVFDEAQRAWSAEHMERKKKGVKSEPEILLEIMNRCPDWGVVVALVGGGQEINTGESGLSSWGHAIGALGPAEFDIFASQDALSGGVAVGDNRLFDDVAPNEARLHTDDALHLAVAVRSPRALTYATWVERVLGGDTHAAAQLASAIPEFPIYLTRSVARAESWLRQRTTNGGRAGLVASSMNRRLRRYGIQLSTRNGQSTNVANWFLAPGGDVRSSKAFEIAAIECECQGLELDYVGLCWGDDFTRTAGAWRQRRFSGTRWLTINQHERRQYQVNTYRVLLTRARSGIVIVVPPGCPNDPTRRPDYLDATADYLLACGAQPLDETDAGLDGAAVNAGT